ncbi:hypothetical protein AB0M29_28715 [Streptomyces sp. NPDC051976]|uniref:hypothetical protein n=1 Tax=Streptomyces sp. NPDC051976 TaxID=3154947 RepID=UPI00342F602F
MSGRAQTTGEYGDEDPSGLKPIGAEVRAASRDLALSMRLHFAGVGMSLRMFAIGHHMNPATVSRYLSAQRLPDKHFLDVLLYCWQQRQEREVAEQEIMERRNGLYQLHGDALLAGKPGQYQLQQASDRLEEAALQQEQAEMKIKDLEEGVAHRQQQCEALERQLRELERGAVEQRATGAEIAVYRGRELALTGECERLREEIRFLEQELARALWERDQAREACQRLEARLEEAEDEAEREQLEELAATERRRLAEAAGMAEDRREELDRAHAEADAVRLAARREAAERREEAEALWEETRAKAVRAAADLETDLAERQEESERALAERRGKAERWLAEIEDRAEQLRLEAEKLRGDAERRARETVESAVRQSEDIVGEAHAKAGRIAMESERELAALTNRRDSMSAQVTDVRERLAN